MKKILFISIVAVLVALSALFFIEDRGVSSFNSTPISSIASPPPTPLTEEVDTKCADAILAQNQYLENEKLSDKFTFEVYPINASFTAKPADLDINSSKYAREFRTKIRQGLETEGINFAGHYSIVSVGMTGWGENHYIVDRINGKAYTFPYYAGFIDFRKNSNLVVINPKQTLLNEIVGIENNNDRCSPAYTGRISIYFTDLRPFYFLWENNKLKLLGPNDIKLPINDFWGI